MAKDQQYTRTVHCIVHSVYRVQLVFGEVQLEEEVEEEENTACGKSLPASQRSPTLTSELHSTHRLSAAHCTQRSLLRLIF